MQIHPTNVAANISQSFESSQWVKKDNAADAAPQPQAQVEAEESDSDKKGPSLAELAETFAKMLENVRDGRPADKDEEESRYEAALNEFKKKQGDGKASPEESDAHAGTNRIRMSLGASGFERDDVDAYIQAMKMPETEGDSRIIEDRREEQKEELLEEQKQEQQIENRLTDPQQLASSMTYQATEAVDEIEQMRGLLPTVHPVDKRPLTEEL